MVETGSDDERQAEINQLRATANNLAQTLQALQQRMDDLEVGASSKNAQTNHVDDSSLDLKSLDDGAHTSDVQVDQHETIEIDPATGARKRTVVTEKVITTRTYHPISSPTESRKLTSPEIGATIERHMNLLAQAYEARIVSVNSDDLRKVDVELICGEPVVIKVPPEVSNLIHPGDTIVEVDGKPVHSKKELYGHDGTVRLKLVTSTIYNAPMVFCRAISDYTKDPAINIKRGDILQILNTEGDSMQARKINDLSRAFTIPKTLKGEQVAMLTPYGRRTLVLLGAAGVGRRTLKSMLLSQLPHHFGSIIPLTSRAPKTSEQHGREYEFVTKEFMRDLIRRGEMVEWGELGGEIYGTSSDSVRRVVRSGRVCVLDAAPASLKHLYTSEFMPFVVVIAPPPYEELVQMNKLRGATAKTDAQLRATSEQHEKLLQSNMAQHFDLILVNRNHDISFRRLLDCLSQLKTEPQWVPLSWLS